jgi:SAM-dependent methyltransferase
MRRLWKGDGILPEDAEFDRRYGLTPATAPAPKGVAAAAAADFVHYEPVPGHHFAGAMRALPSQLREYTFVDYGCGLGKALMLAAAYGFERLIGVDYVPRLCAGAEANLERFFTARPTLRVSCSVLCVDARQFTLPPGSVVAYLFNPFGQSILREVMNGWELWLREQGTDLWVVYINARHHRLFDESGWFERVAGSPWSPDFTLTYRATRKQMSRWA